MTKASTQRQQYFVGAAVWYATSQGFPSFVSPFLPIYYAHLGFSPSKIGLLSALRPWISAPCGSIAANLADRWEAHRLVLVSCFLLSLCLQAAMVLDMSASFPWQLILTLLVSSVWTGASIIADASIMAASAHPGEYGQVRTWASVAWVLCAPLSGWVNEVLGLKIGVLVYFLGSLLAIPAAMLLPLHMLVHPRRAEIDLEQPLLYASPEGLVSEQHIITPENRELAKALAIVRLIENLTELNAVPPPSSLYGFAEMVTPYAASHISLAPSTSVDEEVMAYNNSKISDLNLGRGPNIKTLTNMHQIRSAGDLLQDMRGIQRPNCDHLRGGDITATAEEGEEEEEEGEEEEGEEEEGEEGVSGLVYSMDEDTERTGILAHDNISYATRRKLSISSTSRELLRSSALQRLAQIFGRSPDRSTATATPPHVSTSTPRHAQESMGMSPHSIWSCSSTGLNESYTHDDRLQGFTPIENYLNHRRHRLATELSLNNVHFHLSDDEAVDDSNNATSLRALEEALDLEASDLMSQSPSGRHANENATRPIYISNSRRLIIDVLTKKLKRMAAEKERKKRKKAYYQRKKMLTASTAPSPSSQRQHEVEEVEQQQQQQQISYTHSMYNPRIIAFFTIATLLGFGHGVIGTFFFMFLKVSLGGGEGLMGLVLLANALPEMPVFWYFGSILSTVGMDTLLIASAFALAIRLAAYSVFLHASFLPLQSILVLETIHAITYACGWSACAINAAKIAPPGLESTTQAIFQGLWTGVGCGTGAVIGGVLYHWKGPDLLFLGSAGVIFLGSCVCGVIMARQHFKKRFEWSKSYNKL